MIEVKNLRKIYKPKKGAQVNALDGVSLKFPDTGMVFILGKSGSGKSTLLNVIGGLDKFDSGDIIIKGTSSKDFKQSHFDSYRNTYIGFIFQEYNILEEMTVGANIGLAIELQGRKATNEEVNDILKEVDLEGYGARKPNELSGGQKQRVAIARALVKKPKIIMADEPTGALDSNTGKQVFDTLKKLSREKLVIIVSHDREFSEQYADRIIELKDGVVISDVSKIESLKDKMEEDSSSDVGIVYSESEIVVKQGYTLTEQDRLDINAYLSGNKKDIIIRSGGSKRLYTSKDFSPTDESKIENDKGDQFKLIRSRLSLKNAFRIGGGGLKHKKFRLVLTIFLSLISFTLFGLADTVAAYDSIRTTTNSILDTGIDYLAFSKSFKEVYGNGEDDFYWSDAYTYLTADDLDEIKQKTGASLIGVYNKNLNLDFSANLGNSKDNNVSYEKLYPSSFMGVTPFDEKALADMGYSKEDVTGVVPSPDSTDEIVVSDFIYDYFTKVGYKTEKDGESVVLEVKNENDLIGKTLNIASYDYKITKYKIVGILNTGIDYSRYEIVTDLNEFNKLSMLEQMTVTSEVGSFVTYSSVALAFVSPKTVDDIIEKTKTVGTELNSTYLNFNFIEKDAVIRQDEYGSYNIYEYNSYFSSYVGKIAGVSDMEDGIIWIGEPHALADNEIIISADNLFSLIYCICFKDGQNEQILLQGDVLKGFEATLKSMYDKGEYYFVFINNLYDVIVNAREIAFAKHVYENKDTVKELVLNTMDLKGDEYAEYLNSFSSLLDAYHGLISEGRLENPITDAVVEEYLNGVISDYGLNKGIFVSKEMADLFETSVAYNGYTFTNAPLMNSSIMISEFLNNYRRNAYSMYAVDNVEDAIRYYEYVSGQAIEDKSALTEDKIFSMIFEYFNAIDFYVRNGYFPLASGEKDDTAATFVPESKIDPAAFANSKLLELYSIYSNEAKGVLTYYKVGGEHLVDNIKIAGVIGSESESYYDLAVVSDTLYSGLVNTATMGDYSFAIGSMPETEAEVRGLVEFSKTEFDGIRFDIQNNVTMQLSTIDELLLVLGKVFLWVGVCFAIFAALMLSNFIGTSISFKKQDIGILRAIGSRSADVFKIFFAEAFIIAMINFLLSSVCTGAVSVLINSTLRNDVGLLITFLRFGPRQVGLLLAVSLLVALLATFFPVKRIARMKPIDAIKNRK